MICYVCFYSACNIHDKTPHKSATTSSNVIDHHNILIIHNIIKSELIALLRSNKRVPNKNITTESKRMHFSMVFMTTELPGSNVRNSVHLSVESPRTCIFWQVQLTASHLGVQLDQTSLPPPRSHNQYKQRETKRDEEKTEKRLFRQEQEQNNWFNGADMLSFQQTMRTNQE